MAWPVGQWYFERKAYLNILVIIRTIIIIWGNLWIEQNIILFFFKKKNSRWDPLSTLTSKVIEIIGKHLDYFFNRAIKAWAYPTVYYSSEIWLICIRDYLCLYKVTCRRFQSWMLNKCRKYDSTHQDWWNDSQVIRETIRQRRCHLLDTALLSIQLYQFFLIIILLQLQTKHQHIA